MPNKESRPAAQAASPAMASIDGTMITVGTPCQDCISSVPCRHQRTADGHQLLTCKRCGQIILATRATNTAAELEFAA